MSEGSDCLIWRCGAPGGSFASHFHNGLLQLRKLSWDPSPCDGEGGHGVFANRSPDFLSAELEEHLTSLKKTYGSLGLILLQWCSQEPPILLENLSSDLEQEEQLRLGKRMWVSWTFCLACEGIKWCDTLITSFSSLPLILLSFSLPGHPCEPSPPP
jgi:hypothetical protein